jgi:cysteinyl-tRNA synthetase
MAEMTVLKRKLKGTKIKTKKTNSNKNKLEIHNTLSGKIEEFKSLKKNSVSLYVCGPTVNDVPHLGHARQQITFDVLRRYLEFIGYKVKFVSNITDIEDKIISKANELKISIDELTKKNEKAHKEDYEKIGVSKPDVQPRATEYVKEMIDLVKKLEEKGYTYVIEEDGVYYNTWKFKGYGKLSKQNLEKLRKGVRVSSNEKKRNEKDFVLWKFSKPGEPRWDSPWGKGRPGWHIECSAMSHSILGLPLDIHGGGQDLIFPHHEDEIAQSEAAYGKKLANYWIHNGMVNVNNIKMSKSLGNFRTIRNLLEEYRGEVIRYFVLSTHYRKPIDFSKESLDDAKNSYQRLKNIVEGIKEKQIKLKVNEKIVENYLNDFRKAMNNDLNSPKALQTLWKLVRDESVDESSKIKTIEEMDKVFGLGLLDKETLKIPKEIKELAEEREKARKDKNWKLSDELREKIKSKGYSVEDKPEGYSIKKSD